MIKRIRRAVANRLRSPLILRWTTRAFALGSRRTDGDSVGTTHVLVCPPGAGNLGDQALVEAFIENTTGSVLLVARSESDIRIPAEFGDRVRIVALPALLYGKAPGSIRDGARFMRLLRDAASLSICGADIMDGAYNFRASANRATLAEAGARQGIPTRVLGFSWNGQPHRVALSYLRSAAERGVDLYLRDPRSEARARADGLSRVAPAADIVFAARTVDDSLAREWIAKFADPDRPVALVNISGLIRARAALVHEYVAILEELRTGHNVLLVPHVVKPGSDDAEASREVLAHLPDREGILLLDAVLTPRDVRGLCRRADVVVTGRMHLAVNALGQGRTPVTLATQGKVEGLMELFDASALCVVPEGDLAASVRGAIAVGSAMDRTRLAADLDAVKTLASASFEGLAGVGSSRGGS